MLLGHDLVVIKIENGQSRVRKRRNKRGDVKTHGDHEIELLRRCEEPTRVGKSLCRDASNPGGQALLPHRDSRRSICVNFVVGSGSLKRQGVLVGRLIEHKFRPVIRHSSRHWNDEQTDVATSRQSFQQQARAHRQSIPVVGWNSRRDKQSTRPLERSGP